MDGGSSHTVTTVESLLINFNSERVFLSVSAPDSNPDVVWLRMSAQGTAVANAGLMLRAGDIYIFEKDNRYVGGIRGVTESETCTVAISEF